MIATISAAAGSNVDTNAFVGVSNGGAKSVGGDYLEMDTRMKVSADLTQSILLRINEGPANQYRWSPGVGTIELGPTSPVVLHFTELYVSDTGAIQRDWLATSGSINVTALSGTMISFTLNGATMTSNSRSARGTFTLNGSGANLVF